MSVLCGCIHNDLPYPVIVPHITSMDVKDAVDVDIDFENQIVTVYVSETTDLRTVEVKGLEFDQDITKSSIQLIGVHDMTSPIRFVLTTYQDYEWTLKAVRPVERYFSVAGQVGSSVIDEFNHRVIAMVAENVDISDLTVTSFKHASSAFKIYF